MAKREPDPMRNPTRAGGFTLLELMIALAVGAIILTVGVAGFQTVINSGRVTGPANDLLAAVQSARIDALRTGRRAVICRSDAPDAASPSCSAGGGAWTGWLSFVDADGDGVLDAGERLLRSGSVKPPTVFTASAAITGASNLIVVRPDGMARAGNGALLGARLRFCVPSAYPPENARDVVITAGSRIVVERASLAGACTVPGN